MANLLTSDRHGKRSSSASCGASRSSTSTTASSTSGRRWPAPGWRPTAGAAPRRCCTSTAGRAQAALPAHRRPAQPQHAAAPPRAAGDRRRADAEAFDEAVDIVGTWSRDERREGVKVMLQALAEKRIGRRDQANAWIWRLAEYTREVHEEYAVQRWPETKRLLGLLVNSSGAAHARNARRLVHAARKQDRRLSAALLAASLAHTPEARAGARRRAHPHGPQAQRARARAAAQLPQEGPRSRSAPPPEGRQGGGRRRRPLPTRRSPRRPRRPRRPRPPRPRTSGRGGPGGRSGRRGGGDQRRRRCPGRRACGRGRRRSGGGGPRRGARERGVDERASRRDQSGEPSPRTPRRSTRPSAKRSSRTRLANPPGAPRPRGAPCARRRRAPRPAARPRPLRPPSPRPSGPRHGSARQRVAGAPRVEDLGLPGREPALEAREQPSQRGLHARRAGAQRRRRVAQLGRELVRLDRDVEADAEHGPALLRPALDEDPRDLAARREHVVGPLDRRASAPTVSATATAAASGNSRGQLAQQQRHQQRRGRAARSSARPWRPRPAVCSAAVTSVPCGAPAAASVACAVVGRVGRGAGAAAGGRANRAHAAAIRSSSSRLEAEQLPPRCRG